MATITCRDDARLLSKQIIDLLVILHVVTRWKLGRRFKDGSPGAPRLSGTDSSDPSSCQDVSRLSSVRPSHLRSTPQNSPPYLTTAAFRRVRKKDFLSTVTALHFHLHPHPIEHGRYLQSNDPPPSNAICAAPGHLLCSLVRKPIASLACQCDRR